MNFFESLNLLSVNKVYIISINNTNGVDNEKYIDFKENRENSKLFKEAIAKEIKLMKGLMSKDEFKINYINNNKKEL